MPEDTPVKRSTFVPSVLLLAALGGPAFAQGAAPASPFAPGAPLYIECKDLTLHVGRLVAFDGATYTLNEASALNDAVLGDLTRLVRVRAADVQAVRLFWLPPAGVTGEDGRPITPSAAGR